MARSFVSRSGTLRWSSELGVSERSWWGVAEPWVRSCSVLESWTRLGGLGFAPGAWDRTLREERRRGAWMNAQNPTVLTYLSFQRFAKVLIGCIAAVVSGVMHVFYLSAYHERKFWFSNRQELEREITFQGDSAIYYSYYKDMLKAPTFERGVYELTHNNKTVSLRTINAVQQLSLYPELIASVLYRATGSHRFCYLLMSASTYTFMMVWEYSHYVLFLQAVSLLLLDVFSEEQSDKLNGKKGTFVSKVIKVFKFYLVCTLPLTLNLIMKTFVPHKENEHVLKFLEVKFGLNVTNGKSQKEIVTLEDGRIGERPEIIYHVFHTLILGSLAMLMEGLKFLWTPYVCMLAAFGVCSPELWMTLLKWLRLRTVHPILLALILSMAVPTIIGLSLWKEFFPRLITELTELQEFYDPDTVELMTWIKRQAPVAAVFAGSPQLMGVIKLCTGWMVTSLPLYSDDDLLKRNENIYQIYSKRSAEDIYKILTSYKANYLIVEDAICNEMGTMRGCRVKDLLDVANGHQVTLTLLPSNQGGRRGVCKSNNQYRQE
ncbi:putative C-mannosyltransferase DPY19L4 [Microtus ochrogaster]|uniref:Putative C-mannosyltransferase DPY19L4 n=1 Tax=Microtus ochrogaster TaxID=79684 RepID=A0A8J6L7R2_MICOH|nr:putative C-mannosyltransferase DPY19L4 [Microtus ochrogaster]